MIPYEQYKIATVPLAKSFITQQGVAQGLCTSCKTKDCPHPIEFYNVSIMGVQKKLRVWKSATTIALVVNCTGYAP